MKPDRHIINNRAIACRTTTIVMTCEGSQDRAGRDAPAKPDTNEADNS